MPLVHKHKILIVSSLVILFAQSGKSQMPGDLLITPPRVVFEGKKRYQELGLMNVGRDSATYEISWIQYRMSIEGKFIEIAKPDSGQLFADQLVRFFPRRVTLAPQESQSIRMQTRVPSGAVSGEYRSHLYFRAVPQSMEPDSSRSANPADSTGFSVRLTPIYGWAIPIIVRVGNVTAEVTLSDLSLQPTADSPDDYTLTFKVQRSGSESVFGDFQVMYYPNKGSSIVVGNLNAIAVYTPNRVRKIEMALSIPPGKKSSPGRLVVRYLNRSDTKEDLLGESAILFK
jgi:hypothetical protein